jgi:hypothetical protein
MAFLALAFPGVGCGGTDGGASSPQDSYPTRYAEAFCGAIAPCCQANGLTFDRDQCLLGGAAFGQQGVDAAKSANATFDADTANACIAAASVLTQACKTLDADPSGSACSRVFDGPKAPGSSCASDIECHGGGAGRARCLATPEPGAPKICVVLSGPSKIGDACAPATTSSSPALADCDGSGLYCDLSGKCAAKVALGAACGSLSRCVDGSYCTATGTCAPTAAQGAPCTSSAECTSRYCLHGACAQNAVGTLAPCTGQTQ